MEAGEPPLLRRDRRREAVALELPQLLVGEQEEVGGRRAVGDRGDPAAARGGERGAVRLEMRARVAELGLRGGMWRSVQVLVAAVHAEAMASAQASRGRGDDEADPPGAAAPSAEPSRSRGAPGLALRQTRARGPSAGRIRFSVSERLTGSERQNLGPGIDAAPRAVPS